MSWIENIVNIGCIACYKEGKPNTPAEVHHPRIGAGMSQRASDEEAIPLCPAHHRGTNHPHVSSIHLDKDNFIRKYGTEQELYRLCNTIVVAKQISKNVEELF